MRLGLCLTQSLISVSEWVNMLEGLFVIRLLTIPWGLKKSVIYTGDFGLCSMLMVGKLRILACGLGGRVPIVLWGFLEVEALTGMSHRFCGQL